MKNLKKLAAITAVVAVIGTTGAVYAATTKTPAEIAAGLTGKTLEEVNAERQQGKSYGTIAQEAGKLDEFKEQTLEQRKAILDERVKEGTLTQAQADAIYNAMKENQAYCNGAGAGRIGMMNGAGFGSGVGCGAGRGIGTGRGINK